MLNDNVRNFVNFEVRRPFWDELFSYSPCETSSFLAFSYFYLAPLKQKETSLRTSPANWAARTEIRAAASQPPGRQRSGREAAGVRWPLQRQPPGGGETVLPAVAPSNSEALGANCGEGQASHGTHGSDGETDESTFSGLRWKLQGLGPVQRWEETSIQWPGHQ